MVAERCEMNMNNARPSTMTSCPSNVLRVIDTGSPHKGPVTPVFDFFQCQTKQTREQSVKLPVI